jgi:hypothetical protein
MTELGVIGARWPWLMWAWLATPARLATPALPPSPPPAPPEQCGTLEPRNSAMAMCLPATTRTAAAARAARAARAAEGLQGHKGRGHQWDGRGLTIRGLRATYWWGGGGQDQVRHALAPPARPIDPGKGWGEGGVGQGLVLGQARASTCGPLVGGQGTGNRRQLVGVVEARAEGRAEGGPPGQACAGGCSGPDAPRVGPTGTERVTGAEHGGRAGMFQRGQVRSLMRVQWG